MDENDDGHDHHRWPTKKILMRARSAEEKSGKTNEFPHQINAAGSIKQGISSCEFFNWPSLETEAKMKIHVCKLYGKELSRKLF